MPAMTINEAPSQDGWVYAWQDQSDETRKCKPQARGLHGQEAIAAHEAGEDHGRLHRAEEQQRTGPGTQRNVGIGERRRIRKQVQSRSPVAGQRRSRRAQPYDRCQDEGARYQPHERKGGRVDCRAAECQPAENRIRRECRHCEHDRRPESHVRHAIQQDGRPTAEAMMED